MKAYYLRLIQAAIIAGEHINKFCIKHNAKKGALRSMIFKMWNRVKLLVLSNCVKFTHSHISNCVRIVENNATNSSVRTALKAGSILAKAHLDAFVRVYSFNTIEV